ncbi:hypothetical protein FMA36_17980 (plasmid) [Komagataeibacter xylinus]|uniref:Uncharacterized protein n=1 Tax=Komagataeibacter xylinus TaxID=28448 RepID=A0A857FT46_KOMXY|nr:hypothetical protein FMA36_16825 [Komagataeibacter xylinus]QHC37453.1 hypothetical protein FMA36_17980 [Komagataeibacter xylinus]
MFTSGNTSPCHHSLHLFVKTDESQQAGIVQKLSDQALMRFGSINIYFGIFLHKQKSDLIVRQKSS